MAVIAVHYISLFIFLFFSIVLAVGGQGINEAEIGLCRVLTAVFLNNVTCNRFTFFFARWLLKRCSIRSFRGGGGWLVGATIAGVFFLSGTYTPSPPRVSIGYINVCVYQG